MNRNGLCNTSSVCRYIMSRPSKACAIRSSSGGQIGSPGASSSSPHKMCLSLILLLEFRDLGPSANLHESFAFTATSPRAGATRPPAGVFGLPRLLRGHRQGVVRRNFPSKACRRLIEVRMTAEGVEGPLCKHCSQICLRVPAMHFLQPQVRWTVCACIAAVRAWARRAPTWALGPYPSFRAEPVPLSSCWRLAWAGQRMQGAVWHDVSAPYPGASQRGQDELLSFACP